MKRNPRYWRTTGSGEPLPRLNRLVFEVIPDANASLLRLKAGEVDLVDSLSPESFLHLQEAGLSDLDVMDLGPGMVVERLWFNLNPDSPIPAAQKSWYQDVRFRRAISNAIDRSGMAEVVFSGLASPAEGPVSPANYFWRNTHLEPSSFDLEAARRLLREAGFLLGQSGSLLGPGGEEVSLSILTNTESAHRVRMASFLEEDLRAHRDPGERPVTGWRGHGVTSSWGASTIRPVCSASSRPIRTLRRQCRCGSTPGGGLLPLFLLRPESCLTTLCQVW